MTTPIAGQAAKLNQHILYKKHNGLRNVLGRSGGL
jgi:hypothetical protein